jgi:hypothetical protein
MQEIGAAATVGAASRLPESDGPRARLDVSVPDDRKCVEGELNLNQQLG